jgi:hypothetical protein
VAPPFHALAPPGLSPFDADVLMPYAVAAHERGR